MNPVYFIEMNSLVLEDILVDDLFLEDFKEWLPSEQVLTICPVGYHLSLTRCLTWNF